MEALQINPLIFEKLVTDIASQGWSVVDGLFSEGFYQLALKRLGQAQEQNQLKPAGIGLHQPHQDKNIRSDDLYWLDPAKSPLDGVILNLIDEVRLKISRTLFLGLPSQEVQLARYSKGSSYEKHWDVMATNPDKPSARVITFIHYLNSSWTSNDGGELCLFKANETELLQKIAPTFGRSVFFISKDFPHEVLKTQKERMSCSGWYRSDSL